MSRLGIELLCVFGMPPVDHVKLAAELGCGCISGSLIQGSHNPEKFPAWSLREDPALRREMKAAMRDSGVVIGLGEGLLIRPNVDIRDQATEFDLFAELGTKRISGISMDPDLGRTFDQYALLVEMAAQRGMKTAVEFVPVLPISDLPTALKLVRHVNTPSFNLTIDTMHLCRSGGSAADLKALPVDSIGYVQVCDAPLKPSIPDYFKEAMFSRLPPGKGELPLLDILDALPRDVPLSLEVPQLKEAEAGIKARDRVKPAVEALRGLLARLGEKV